MPQGAEVLAEPGEVFRIEPEQGFNSRDSPAYTQGIRGGEGSHASQTSHTPVSPQWCH